MAFDTGMEPAVIRDLLAAFGRDCKALYVDGYVVLPNHAKNQHLGTNSELARKKMIEALPPAVREALLHPAPLAQEAAPLAKQFNLIKHNTIELNREGKKQKAAPLAPPATIEQRKDKFMEAVFSDANVASFGRPMLTAFVNYWGEENRSGTKMRFELQPTWKLAGRLATWASREIKNKGGGKPSRLTYTED